MSTRGRPEMNSLLDDRQQSRAAPTRKQKFRKPAAVALALALVGAFILGLIYLSEALDSNPSLHPLRRFLFPLMAITTLVLLFPLIFYISFQDEFGDINPVIPSHYIFLLRKSLKAIKDNDFKVEAKNL